MNKRQLLKQKAMLEAYINLNVCHEESFGLCDNVLINSEDYWYWYNVFRSWSCFEGSLIYAVEGNRRAYDNNDSKHDRRTKYGKRRLSLAKHCLKHVLTELKELES